MQGMGVGPGGRRRKVAIEPNIVPFIDLMSVLIIFLLITAVWSQVSMIQIGSSIYGQKNDENTAPITPHMDVPFRVDLIGAGYKVIIDSQSYSIPKVNGEYDLDSLLKRLQKIKVQYPEKVDSVITLWDEVIYNDLIKAMDAILQAGFPEVVISTIEVK